MPAVLRIRHFAVLSIILAAALVASSFALATPADAATRRQQKIWTGLDIARAQQGDPYRYGATGPGAFDCSGLTYYSYRKAGLRNIPRTSSQQARFTRRIDRRDMRRGDFVFFYSGRARAGNVYHLGVFSGWKDGRRVIVHASRSGTPVKRDPIWTSRWFAGTLRGL